MKITTVLFCALFLLAGYSNIVAQVPPSGAGDKSLEDRNIKGRSNELERIKRDAQKPDPKNQPQVEKLPETKFQEIKEDFEQIQIAQSDIVTAYTKSKDIDYVKISADAAQISKRGLRLKDNLFAAMSEKPKKAKDDKKSAEALALSQDVKSLIVEMDNTLAAFTGNPMFTNPQVVNPDNNAKAQSDLEKLIRLSAALQDEAYKASKQNK